MARQVKGDSAPPPQRQRDSTLAEDWADLLASDESELAGDEAKPAAGQPIAVTKRCASSPEELSVRPSELTVAHPTTEGSGDTAALSVDPDELEPDSRAEVGQTPSSTETIRHAADQGFVSPVAAANDMLSRHHLRHPTFPASSRVPRIEEILPSDPDGERDWGPSAPPLSDLHSPVSSSEIPHSDDDDPLSDSDHVRMMQEPSIVPSLRAQRSTPHDLATMNRVQTLYAAGDFASALEHAEILLHKDQHNFEARRYAENCREELEKIYTSRLEPLNRPVVALLSAGELERISLDHRAGFVLSLVDGTSSVEDILDLSAMQRLDALRILSDLVVRKVIRLGHAP